MIASSDPVRLNGSAWSRGQMFITEASKERKFGIFSVRVYRIVSASPSFVEHCNERELTREEQFHGSSITESLGTKRGLEG